MDISYDAFEIKVENHLAYPFEGVLGFGSCLPAGAISGSEEFHLEDRAGNLLPLEWRPLIRDADGSCRWAYFSFPARMQPSQFQHWKVKPGALQDYARLECVQNDNEICIRNGGEEIVFRSGCALGLAELWSGKVPLLECQNAGAEMVFDGKKCYRAGKSFQVSIRHANSFEVVVQALGTLTSPEEQDGGIYFRLLYTIRLGRAGIDVNAAFSNRRESDEELTLQRLAVSFGLGGAVAACHVRQNASDNLCLSQDYAIEGAVRIENGVLIDPPVLEIPTRESLWPFFKKYNRQAFFGRVAPFAAVCQEQGGLIFAWQRSASLEVNSFAAQERRATLELVSEASPERAIPQGFSRSFDFSITEFTGDIDGEEAFRLAAVAEYQPLISVHPRWYIQNGAEEMERVLPYRPDLNPRFEKQLWREFAMGYCQGFYDSGDYPSGRGEPAWKGITPPYTWNNNEEDHLKGIAWMLMRTGDPGYLEDMRRCARHLLEVDRIAYSSHPLQDGILIAHARNHFDGAGYPSHCWAEGILLYYKLTGDEDALGAFMKLCDCLLGWIHTTDRTRFADAREMGVPITNFAHAYTLTQDDKYLQGAKVYIDHFRRQMDEDGGLYYQKGAVWTRYSEYVAVEGLWDYYEMIGGEEIKVLLLDIIQWISNNHLDISGVYDARAISESFLHLFYIAYRLTGDELWLEKGRPGLEAALSQSSSYPLLKFGNNGAYYKEAIQRGWFRVGSVGTLPEQPCRIQAIQ